MIKTKLYNTKERRILGTIEGHLEQFVKLENCVIVEFDSDMDIKAALKNYYYMRRARENISRQLEAELNQRTALQAANFELPHGAGNDPVERKVELLLQQDATIKKLKADKWRLENDLIVCDILLDQLTPEERKVIDCYYIKPRYTWIKTAEMIYISERSCRRKRDAALEKMQEFLKI